MYQYVQCLQGFSIRCYPQCFLSNEIFGSVHVTNFSVTLADFSRAFKRLEFSRQNYPPSFPLFIYSFCFCISAHRAASVFVGADCLHVVGAVFMRWICLPHVKPPLHPEVRWFSVRLFLPLATCFSFLKRLRIRLSPLSLSYRSISRVTKNQEM